MILSSIPFIDKIVNYTSQTYDQIFKQVPASYILFYNILFNSILIISYISYVFYSSKLLSRKNVFNPSSDKKHSQSFSIVIYLFKYMIIIPAITILWFYITASFLYTLLPGIEIASIFAITATLIISIRGLSYLNEGITHDISKVILLGFVVFFVITFNPYSTSLDITRILDIPKMMSSIFYYLVFIVLLELIMRTIYLIVVAMRGDSMYRDIYVLNSSNKIFEKE